MSNKVSEAVKLPKVLNLNPRSIYNKVKIFETFVDKHDTDLVCVSESWELGNDKPDNENKKLEDIIKLENMEIVSNVFQRCGTGGRHAIFVNKSKFVTENLTNTLISGNSFDAKKCGFKIQNSENCCGLFLLQTWK